jgi:PAS domain S-box-containing protein
MITSERLSQAFGSSTVPPMQRTALANEHTLALDDSTEQLGSPFENSTLGIAIADRVFRFLTANPAFLAMLGYSSEELQQLSFLDLCVEENRDEYRVPLHELREGARFQYEIETQYQRKDGTYLPVNIYFSAVSARAPKQLAFLVVTVDITARRAAEDALRAAQSELARVARLTTVGTMVASMAHELNQPLASIVTNGNAGLRWLGCELSLGCPPGPGRGSWSCDASAILGRTG